MKRRFAFIGGGVMAEAILRGVLDSGLAAAGELAASDPLPGRRQALSELGIVAAATNAEAVAGAETVILAVKPRIVPAALGSLSTSLQPEQLLVSIAAGVSLHSVEGLAPSDQPVVRAMPNILASVRSGSTALCGGRSALPAHLEAARQLFQTVGGVYELPESMLDAVTALSGSGPGFVMVLIDALADGGVLAGLPRETALELATDTVMGTARLLRERGEHPGVWKDRVATPGGTTMAGIAALEAAGVRSGLIQAVLAAARRAEELSELN